MTSRTELVRQAIKFQSPERIPVVYWNCDQTDGDVMLYHLGINRTDNDATVNEWGYRLETLDDGTMGHPTSAHLPDWTAVDDFSPPDLAEEERMAAAPAFFDECEDRYRLASYDLSGFTVFTLLRGYENSMTDFLIEPERSGRLMDMICDFECAQMDIAARHGFHGIHFADDWGTQSGLMISPGLWRELFKPRYKKQFAHAHSLGLDVWFHCCGNFIEIVEDFNEIGVDVLNISQPNVMDIDEVGRRLKGKQAFMMPISYQTVSIQGSVEEIHAEAERLFRLLATPQGGFIGYVEEYSSMGMSQENYRACGEAWARLSCG
ncbi:MAG: hypothetical protein JXM70_15775 [Pirellulales bacterium]|nr:hypothetical protein [Pirellulales bacterium]